uniref:Globin domain-containing protein n=1 Tax=Leptobrachium leishanense TaxID=445787 RepID=A0A8C5MHA3_9ANUR
NIARSVCSSLISDLLVQDGASVVGAEVMFMFFTVCPDAKSHFSHFDQSQGSPDLLSHGGKIVNAIGGEIKDLDDLSTVMAALTELHTNKLKVTPEHMEDLSCTILVTLARNYQEDFTSELLGAVFYKLTGEQKTSLFKASQQEI